VLEHMLARRGTVGGRDGESCAAEAEAAMAGRKRAARGEGEEREGEARGGGLALF
jgi:hypothetical protein